MKDDPLAPSSSQPSPDARPSLGADDAQSHLGPAPSRTGVALGVREVAALLLLGLAVLFLYLANAAVPVEPPAGFDLPAKNLELRFQAQFELGMRQLFAAEAPAQDSEALDSLAAFGGADASIRRLEALALTPRDRIALAAVRVHLGQSRSAQTEFAQTESLRSEALETTLASLSSLEADPSLDEQIREEASWFAHLLREPDWDPDLGPDLGPDRQFDVDTRDRLLATYGYFARLALDPEPALDESRRTALVFYALAAAALLALVLGSLALIFLLQRASRGKLHSRYRRRYRLGYRRADRRLQADSSPSTPAERLPYLETALVFLVAVTVVGGLVGLAMAASGSQWPLLLNWSVVAVLFWPLVRGRSWADLRRALGWHRGRGVLREIGCGLLAYLASMPILAVGLALTLVFTRFTEQPPHHPIVDWLQETGAGGIAIVVVLAVLWAPLVEESLFRGGLYHYFRGRLGIFGSALLVSLAFAAIHPQGLAGIPFLTTLAFVLALTREWRDSIIASVTLHMVHNGLATLLLLSLLS